MMAMALTTNLMMETIALGADVLVKIGIGKMTHGFNLEVTLGCLLLGLRCHHPVKPLVNNLWRKMLRNLVLLQILVSIPFEIPGLATYR